MKNWKTWTRGVGLGFVVVGLVLGECSDDDDSSGGTDMDTGLGDTSTSGDTADTGSVDDIGTDMGGTPETTSIRAIHLSPDAPGVDIFVTKTAPAAVSNLTFPNGTGFLQIPAGTYTFDIAPTGTTVDGSVLTVDRPIIFNIKALVDPCTLCDAVVTDTEHEQVVLDAFDTVLDTSSWRA